MSAKQEAHLYGWDDVTQSKRTKNARGYCARKSVNGKNAKPDVHMQEEWLNIYWFRKL